jgi:hypothetical protein
MFGSGGIFNLFEIEIVSETGRAWSSFIYYISYTILKLFSKYSIGYKLLAHLVFLFPKDYQQFTIMIMHMLICDL